MSDQQQLNSVDRFRKQAGRLVLEEHGHCEVPAGCGGVVMRWRNPFALQSVLLTIYTPEQAHHFIDGAAPASTRFDLAIGRHVVAVHLESVALSGPLLLFSAIAAHKH